MIIIQIIYIAVGWFWCMYLVIDTVDKCRTRNYKLKFIDVVFIVGSTILWPLSYTILLQDYISKRSKKL